MIRGSSAPEPSSRLCLRYGSSMGQDQRSNKTYLCCSAAPKPTIKACKPSPVWRLTAQLARDGNEGGCSNLDKSILLNNMNVSSLIKGSILVGIRMSPDSVKTSGDERTQRETSEDSTLQASVRLLSARSGITAYSRFARSTPMLSTTSLVWRSPAVSATMTGRPPMSSESSRTSLVVPGIGVTMAASR